METSLTFGKRIDDIEAAVLLPEDWYVVELTQAPSQEANNAKKEDPSSPDAGDNWVVRVKTVADEPEHNGRPFTAWLGIPKDGDDLKYTRDGQKVYDAKMERIVGFVEAFQGTIEADTVRLGQGARGQIYVSQGINRQSGEVENSVNIFAGFKRAKGTDDPHFP